MRRWLELALLLLLSWPVLAAEPLRLHDSQQRVELWPAVTQWVEPQPRLSLEQAWAQREQFRPPSTARNTLGQRPEAVWLRIPVQELPGSDGRWVFELDYPVLNRIELYLLDREGRLLQQARMGSFVPSAQRPLPTRAHAVELQLQPGGVNEIWLRLESQGALIAPITLSKEAAFLAHGLREQMLQGLLTGLGLYLVFYSFAQWISLRERLLLKYALLIGSGVMFSVVQFGIGAQFLWEPGSWPDRHGAGISALLAAAGTFLFVEEVLRGPERWRWFSPLMKAGAALLVTVAAAYGLGLISLHVVSRVVGSIGLAPALLGLPGALQRVRRGDAVGWYFIAAWLGYFFSTAVMVKTIRGEMPANFWTLHSFQFGATLDMLLFLRVLALRLHAVYVQRDRALSLAATDTLTGLANRRGLAERLATELPRCTPESLAALYLLDLDGFKPVNDMHGHAAGDQLLVAVAERLRAQVRTHARHADLVVRLGGDEFIVLATGLPGEHQAKLLGEQLLRAFDQPFAVEAAVQGLPITLGVTIGYALAPLDGHDAESLLDRADAAMYAGKRGGKRRLARAGHPG